jgi:hypothetical protein
VRLAHHPAPRFNAAGVFDMTYSRLRLAACAAMLIALGCLCSPARADNCDDLARQLTRQIDGLKVGATRGGIIDLRHPLVAQASLGCSSRNKQAEFYAASPLKKPPADFVALVASASALIFTVPKGDIQRGAGRCLSRLGLLRGYDISTRFRKLDIHCRRTRDGANITVSREKD